MLDLRRSLLPYLMLAAIAGCKERGKPAGPQTAQSVEVAVVTIEPRPVTLVRDLPGRVAARRVAEVRARVDGIVEARLFTEGSDVSQGDVLYRIEAAPYQATLAAAKANLARAEANRAYAKLEADRNDELLGSNAVSREIQENSAAMLRAANAEVAAAQASVKAARIDLGYTTIRAPIAGRIGRSEVTEGAYVQRAAATRMATIQQLDTVYVDITQSSAELLRLRRAIESHRLTTGADATRLTLVLEDGHEYELPGTLEFADVSVDESTGSVFLRAVFPNQRRELLPGMFVRARVEQGTDPAALLVPQRGVNRDARGQASALVVDEDDRVGRRELEVEQAVGDAWLISRGLSAGDRVIVEGIQKVRPGDRVSVVPAVAETSNSVE